MELHYCIFFEKEIWCTANLYTYYFIWLINTTPLTGVRTSRRSVTVPGTSGHRQTDESATQHRPHAYLVRRIAIQNELPVRQVLCPKLAVQPQVCAGIRGSSSELMFRNYNRPIDVRSVVWFLLSFPRQALTNARRMVYLALQRISTAPYRPPERDVSYVQI